MGYDKSQDLYGVNPHHHDISLMLSLSNHRGVRRIITAHHSFSTVQPDEGSGHTYNKYFRDWIVRRTR